MQPAHFANVNVNLNAGPVTYLHLRQCSTGAVLKWNEE
jgi:hypothetical protein